MVEYRHVDASAMLAATQEHDTSNPSPLNPPQSWVAVKVYHRLEDADEEAEGQRAGRGGGSASGGGNHDAVTIQAVRSGSPMQAEVTPGMFPPGGQRETPGLREAVAADLATAVAAAGAEALQWLPSGSEPASPLCCGSSSPLAEGVKPEVPPQRDVALPGTQAVTMPLQRVDDASRGTELLGRIDQWATGMMPLLSVKSEVAASLPSAAASKEGVYQDYHALSSPQEAGLALSKQQSAASHVGGGRERLCDGTVMDTAVGFVTDDFAPSTQSGTGTSTALPTSGSDNSQGKGTSSHPAFGLPQMSAGTLQPDLLRVLSSVGDSQPMAAVAVAGRIRQRASQAETTLAGGVTCPMRSGSSGSSGWTTTMEDMLREAETRVGASVSAAVGVGGAGVGRATVVDMSSTWSSHLITNIPSSTISVQQQSPSTSASPTTDASMWLSPLAPVAGSSGCRSAVQVGEWMIAGLQASQGDHAAVTAHVTRRPAQEAQVSRMDAVPMVTTPTATISPDEQGKRAGDLHPSLPADTSGTQVRLRMSAPSAAADDQASGGGNPTAMTGNRSMEAAVLVSVIVELSRLHRETKAVIHVPSSSVHTCDVPMGSAPTPPSPSLLHALPRSSFDLPELSVHVDQLLRGAGKFRPCHPLSGGNTISDGGLAILQSPVSDPCLPSAADVGFKCSSNEDRSHSG